MLMKDDTHRIRFNCKYDQQNKGYSIQLFVLVLMSLWTLCEMLSLYFSSLNCLSCLFFFFRFYSSFCLACRCRSSSMCKYIFFFEMICGVHRNVMYH